MIRWFKRGMVIWRQLTWAEPTALPLPTFVVAMYRWVWVLYSELERDQAFVRAGALAYGTLVSLVPLLILSYTLLGFTGILGHDDGVFEDLIFGTFLGDMPEVREVLLPGLQNANFGAVGVVGTAGWLWATFRIYMTMEQAYSRMFGVHVNRSYPRRVMNFYLALTGIPILLASMLFGSVQAASRLHIAWWGSLLSFLVPVLLLSTAIKVLPCTKVYWGPALLGGTLSGLLIQAGSRVFALYVTTFRADDPVMVVYGSLGVIPVFLVWLWLLWIFVLLGVEVAHVAQDYRSLWRAEMEQRRAESERLRVAAVENVIEVASVIARHFLDGRGPVLVETLAARCHLPPNRVQLLIEVLVKRGIVVRTGDCVLMTRPPETVQVREVIDAWRSITAVRRQEGDPFSARIGDAVRASMEGNLADMARHWVNEAP